MSRIMHRESQFKQESSFGISAERQQSLEVTQRRDFSATSLATSLAAAIASKAEYCRKDS